MVKKPLIPKEAHYCPVCGDEFPEPVVVTVELLTPEECGVLWYNLKNHWLDREHNYLLAKELVNRLFRRWNESLNESINAEKKKD